MKEEKLKSELRLTLHCTWKKRHIHGKAIHRLMCHNLALGEVAEAEDGKISAISYVTGTAKEDFLTKQQAISWMEDDVTLDPDNPGYKPYVPDIEYAPYKFNDAP